MIIELSRDWKAAESATGKLKYQVEKAREIKQGELIGHLSRNWAGVRKWYGYVDVFAKSANHGLTQRDIYRRDYTNAPITPVMIGVYITSPNELKARWPVAFEFHTADGDHFWTSPETPDEQVVEMAERLLTDGTADLSQLYPEVYRTRR